jgi:hypothetical protein
MRYVFGYYPSESYHSVLSYFRSPAPQHVPKSHFGA